MDREGALAAVTTEVGEAGARRRGGRPRGLRLVVVLIGLLLAACASRPEGEADAEGAKPEPTPIVAGPGGSHPIVFQKVLFRIPAGTPLSVTRLRGRVLEEKTWSGGAEASDNFNVTATDELKRLGYDVRDASDAVFTPSSTIEARYQIAAIVHGLSLEFEVKRASGRYGHDLEPVTSAAKMDLEFQIYDTVTKSMVATRRVPGESFERSSSVTPMPKAFVAALRRAFADPAFVAPLLKSKGSAARADAKAAPVAVTRCSAEGLDLPGDLPRIQAAVVVVVVGASGGAGTVVSDDGYVLTAAHVVGHQKQTLLRFKSGLELPADVVRVDTGRDAALLKAPGRGYACLRTEPAAVRVGSDIWAVGNPVAEELARSVTRGVASGNRVIHERTYLQTDAAVNPGNSGGPLLDRHGRIRGIVVEKVREAGIEGLGFAVPIADAENALALEWR